MSLLHDWATTWRIPLPALHDLQCRMGAINTDPEPTAPGRSEAAVSNAVRIRASQMGWRLWRNNRGAYLNDYGQQVRYGLCNDSAALDKKIKSSDLVGIRLLVVTPEMVGTTIGQFAAPEIKEEGWTFKGTPREVAQARWIELVISLGGYSKFISHEGQL